MMYRSLEIEGFRGFGSAQRLTLAVPNGTDWGSGLTLIVGENNSGKSSVLEALRSFTTVTPRFSEGQRNKSSGDRVRIVLRSDESKIEIASNPGGGAIAKVSFVNLLKDLGFSRVVGVLDSDRIATAQGLQRDFPQYLFVTIPAPDVRTKPAQQRPEKHGLLDGSTLRQEFLEPVRELISRVNEYLERRPAQSD